MPRKLGKAKRADLTGCIPGEQAEFGAAFARFMEGAGQLTPIEDGTYRDAQARDSIGSQTEIPGMPAHTTERGKDTEIETTPTVGGNGHLSEMTADDEWELPFADDELSPEPMLTPELMNEDAQALDPGEEETEVRSEGMLEPVQWEPSADTLRPGGPLSVKRSEYGPGEDEHVLAETDKLPPRSGSLPTVKPEPHEITRRLPAIEPEVNPDTGVLQPVAPPPAADPLDLNELAPEEDETGIPVEPEPDNKVTNKVRPRRGSGDYTIDAGMRDTVNFYNQTQKQKRKEEFPTIAPGIVNSADALELDPQSTVQLPRPEPVQPDDIEPEETDLLDRNSPPMLSPDAGRDPDRRDTDKYDDRHPERLFAVASTEKIEKSPGKGDSQLAPVTGDDSAFDKDTQRFHDDEPAAVQPPHSGDTTADLEPAQVGPPSVPPGSSDTATGEPTQSGRRDTVKELSVDSGPLPEPGTVNDDFMFAGEDSPERRIIPEIASLEPGGHDPTGDETVDEEADYLPSTPPPARGTSRLTTKVSKSQPAPAAERESDKIVDWQQATSREIAAPAPSKVAAQAAPASELAPGNTGAVSQRLAAERERTNQLIDEAQGVAAGLRQASAQSRADLVAISSRHKPVVVGPGEDTHFEPPVEPESGPRPSEPARKNMEKFEFAPHAVRAFPRVPTQAIGQIIEEIDRKSIEKGPESLSALLNAASQRHAGIENNGGNGRSHPVEDDDMDYLAAASSRLRATLERDLEDERRSERSPLTERYEPLEATEYSRLTEPAFRSSRSHLSQDLDRLWEMLDSRHSPPVALETSVEHSGARPEEDPSEGWTQETLWSMLVGIAAATFLLGAILVYVVFRMVA